MASKLLGPATFDWLQSSSPPALPPLPSRFLRCLGSMIRIRLTFCLELLCLLVAGICTPIGLAQQPPGGTPAAAVATRAFLNKYCVDCHNRDDKTAGLALDDAALDQVAAHTELWEKAVRKLRVRHMP